MKYEEKIVLYEKSIEELKRFHEELGGAYERIKTLIISFIGGGLAFLGYLYQDGDLFIPTEIYGIIFYGIGAILYITGMILLFLATKQVDWEAGIERKKHKKLDFKNYLNFLEYTKNEFIDALDKNLESHGKKAKLLNLASSFLIYGAVILLIIKNFN